MKRLSLICSLLAAVELSADIAEACCGRPGKWCCSDFILCEGSILPVAARGTSATSQNISILDCVRFSVPFPVLRKTCQFRCWEKAVLSWCTYFKLHVGDNMITSSGYHEPLYACVRAPWFRCRGDQLPGNSDNWCIRPESNSRSSVAEVDSGRFIPAASINVGDVLAYARCVRFNHHLRRRAPSSSVPRNLLCSLLSLKRIVGGMRETQQLKKRRRHVSCNHVLIQWGHIRGSIMIESVESAYQCFGNRDCRIVSI